MSVWFNFDDFWFLSSCIFVGHFRLYITNYFVVILTLHWKVFFVIFGLLLHYFISFTIFFSWRLYLKEWDTFTVSTFESLRPSFLVTLSFIPPSRFTYNWRILLLYMCVCVISKSCKLLSYLRPSSIYLSFTNYRNLIGPLPHW